MLGERFETLGHGPVNGGRDLAEIANGFVKLARRRPSVIDVERSAVVEDEADVGIAAEGVVPRQPIDNHGRFVDNEGEIPASHFLVAAPHAMRVDDALGHAGGTRREENLEDGVRADLGVGSI